MFRNSHNSISLSAFTDKPAPRWHIVILAVLLALSFGSAVQTPPLAQAAGAEKRFFIEAKKDGGTATICVGDLVSIHVRVVRAQVRSGVPFNVETIPGVRVLGSADFPNVGQVTPRESRTMWNSDVPGSANFVFHAENPGTTSISFQGRVNPSWGASILERLINPPSGWTSVFDSVDVTVQDCSYKVSTISHFSAQGVPLVATMDGKMKSDGDGHYTGSATVNWVGAIAVAGDCSSVITVYSSKVELFGELDDDWLIVDVTYLPAVLTNIGGCPGGVNDKALLNLDPVTVSVPASGGAKRPNQEIHEPTFYSMSGFVVITVTRVTQE